MTFAELNTQFNKKSVVLTDKNSFQELESQLDKIDEHDTFVCGIIYLYKINNTFLFKETTKKGEIALRRFHSQAEAHDFIIGRLNTYDNMWNGCGCKINYYD